MNKNETQKNQKLSVSKDKKTLVQHNYSTFKDKLLSDPEVQAHYEQQRAEFSIARALIKARISAHMTQKDVALKMHTSQAQIARMESGSHYPSIQSLQRYAHAVNKKITLHMNP